MGDVLNIYCDEFGYTGRDLMSKHQPFYVYAACEFEIIQMQYLKERKLNKVSPVNFCLRKTRRTTYRY